MNTPSLDPRTPVVVGVGQASERLDAQDYRRRLLDLLAAAKEPIGQPAYVRSFGFGNRVTTTRARMDELFPPESGPGVRVG